jgi:hypothetical protein
MSGIAEVLSEIAEMSDFFALLGRKWTEYPGLAASTGTATPWATGKNRPPVGVGLAR